MSEDMK